MAATQAELTALYENIWRALDHSVEGDVILKNYNKEPVMCEGRKMVIPSRDILRAAQWNEVQPFHPLCEHESRGESKVLKRFRVAMYERITMVICAMMEELMTIAADTKRHADLNNAQAEFLSLVPDADAQMVKNLTAVLSKVNPKDGNHIVNIYLKRNGAMLQGKPYKRAAIISFPFLQEFDDPKSKSIFGVEIRKKDVAAIQELFRYVVSNVHVTDYYSAGSNSETAPMFDALMKSWLKITEELNHLVWKYRKHLPDYTLLWSDLAPFRDAEGNKVSIKEMIADLTVYKGLIPSLAGNDGENLTEETAALPTAVMPNLLPTPKAPAPVAAQQVQAPAANQAAPTEIPARLSLSGQKIVLGQQTLFNAPAMTPNGLPMAMPGMGLMPMGLAPGGVETPDMTWERSIAEAAARKQLDGVLPGGIPTNGQLTPQQMAMVMQLTGHGQQQYQPMGMPGMMPMGIPGVMPGMTGMMPGGMPMGGVASPYGVPAMPGFSMKPPGSI